MCTHTGAHMQAVRYFTRVMNLWYGFVFKSLLSLVEFYMLIKRKRCSLMLFDYKLLFRWR